MKALKQLKFYVHFLHSLEKQHFLSHRYLKKNDCGKVCDNSGRGGSTVIKVVPAVIKHVQDLINANC